MRALLVQLRVWSWPDSADFVLCNKSLAIWGYAGRAASPYRFLEISFFAVESARPEIISFFSKRAVSGTEHSRHAGRRLRTTCLERKALLNLFEV